MSYFIFIWNTIMPQDSCLSFRLPQSDEFGFRRLRFLSVGVKRYNGLQSLNPFLASFHLKQSQSFFEASAGHSIPIGIFREKAVVFSQSFGEFSLRGQALGDPETSVIGLLGLTEILQVNSEEIDGRIVITLPVFQICLGEGGLRVVRILPVIPALLLLQLALKFLQGLFKGIDVLTQLRDLPVIGRDLLGDFSQVGVDAGGRVGLRPLIAL